MRIAKLGQSEPRNSTLWQLSVYILAIAPGVAIGEFSATQEVPLQWIFIGIGAWLGVLLLSRSLTITNLPLQRALLYLTLIAGFIGPAFLTIGIGPIHLFPYRILLVLLWVLFAINLLSNQKGQVSISHLRVQPYLQFLILWVLYAFLSLAWTIDKVEAIKDILFLFMAVSMIFFTVYYFRRISDLKGFYHLWLLVLAALVPIGFWETMTGNHLSSSGLVGAPQSVIFMPSAVFTGPNEFATFLTLSMPFILVFIRYRHGILARAFGLAILLASLYLLIETRSRANYLAMILELAFLFIILYKPRAKLRVVVLGGSLLLVLLATFPQLGQRAFDIVNSQLNSITSQWELSYGSAGVRINLIKNSLIFLANTGGFGVGAGNAEYWMENFQIYDTQGITNPHNWWLEVLLQYGLFVFAGYLLFYLGLIFRLYAMYPHLFDKTEKMICEGLLVGLVGFSFASISSSSIMAFNPHWFLFAFGLAFLNYIRNRREVHA